ncbi:GNAT family N-acetyltransferase [Xanthomonas nasturtii]|uniref:GNAT family N-acetyltransferase n=1 Tax=Xanthomonas nasturtii TaxID=1843581 RepID=A0ABT0LW37_9XANT|nr:GNAT family N-acetyltransferase [Xanthomonas nasturtii]MCL1553094.1 GNAT family N-acetyltransferase [Xanthomonas nasturtii]MCL1557184.1 GNAT family N-acetyltransferase [Xanthomonas nasturtii]
MHELLTLQEEGFVLRRWRQDELDALLQHANDPLVPRGLSERFPHPYTRADGEAFLAGRVVDLQHPLLAIEIDGQACGTIAVRPGQGERRFSAELGYWIGRTHWGRGWMTRIVGTYVAWAMQALPLYRVQATVLDTNPASATVLLRNGFVEEGVSRCALMKPDGLHDLRVCARVRPPVDA